MWSSSEDGSDCESPGRTPPSSKEDITSERTLAALDKKATLPNAPLQDPERTLRGQTRRRRVPKGKTIVARGVMASSLNE